jgi:hypothetical protein
MSVCLVFYHIFTTIALGHTVAAVTFYNIVATITLDTFVIPLVALLMP